MFVGKETPPPWFTQFEVKYFFFIILHYGYTKNLYITKTWYHDLFCEIDSNFKSVQFFYTPSCIREKRSQFWLAKSIRRVMPGRCDCIIFSCIFLISNSMVSHAIWKNIYSWVFLSSLKSTLVHVFPKLHSKPYYYLYKQQLIIEIYTAGMLFCICELLFK